NLDCVVVLDVGLVIEDEIAAQARPKAQEDQQDARDTEQEERGINSTACFHSTLSAVLWLPAADYAFDSTESHQKRIHGHPDWTPPLSRKDYWPARNPDYAEGEHGGSWHTAAVA